MASRDRHHIGPQAEGVEDQAGWGEGRSQRGPPTVLAQGLAGDSAAIAQPSAKATLRSLPFCVSGIRVSSSSDALSVLGVHSDLQ